MDNRKIIFIFYLSIYFFIILFQRFSSDKLSFLIENRISSQWTEFDCLVKRCPVLVNTFFDPLTRLLFELFGQLTVRLTELFGQLTELTRLLTVQTEFLGSSNHLLPVRFWIYFLTLLDRPVVLVLLKLLFHYIL